MRYRVTCTTKHEKREHILGLGCYTPDSVFLKFAEKEVVAKIEGRADSFYTEDKAGNVADLEVITRHDGTKYVKTKADKSKPDNLLNLPDCPKDKPPVSPITGSLGSVLGAANHGGLSRWR